MKPQSQWALVCLSIILLVMGGMIISPIAALLLAALVFLCAFPVLFWGTLIPRLIGIGLLAGAVGLGLSSYPAGTTQMKSYLKSYQQQEKTSGSTASTPRITP